MSIFYPAMLRERIQYVTPDDLRSLGVEGILLDVDNTLTKFHSQELSDEVANWLKMMQDEGFKMTVVSNGFAKRVLPFTNKIGLDAVSLSCKPSPIGFGAARSGSVFPAKNASPSATRFSPTCSARNWQGSKCCS